jgi:hypothetical protein
MANQEKLTSSARHCGLPMHGRRNGFGLPEFEAMGVPNFPWQHQYLIENQMLWAHRILERYSSLEVKTYQIY